MESIRSFLKTEAGRDSAVRIPRRGAESVIFDCIECFYDRSRRLS